jgi:hypothetical protein
VHDPVDTARIRADRSRAFRRVYDHTLPLESERARRAYRAPGSVAAKLRGVHREMQPGRTTMVLENERLGF